MANEHATRTDCRLCGARLNDVLDLGMFAPSDFVREQLDEPKVPLLLTQCEDCQLVQLRHTMDRDQLYRHFWYLSGINPSMVESLRDVVDGVQKRVTLQPGDTVVDIGTNDGTLLTLYPSGVNKVGFEPARNLATQALAACDTFVNDYFETSDVEFPQAKVITSIAMFYDLDQPGQFVERVRRSLCADGIWVVQMTDLVRMLLANAFDNVCHEHLCYYSLAQLKTLVEGYGLEIFDVEFNDVNGGSLRAYIASKDAYAHRPMVGEALADEACYLAGDAIAKFSQRVQSAKSRVVEFIRKERAAGKHFHALGASTKGNTLLQYFGIGEAEIDCAAEVNPDKYGLRTAGSNIPIVSQEDSLAQHPDYYLVLPWHFIRFFLKAQAPYLATGGSLLTPLPEPTLHSYHATHL